MAAGESTFVRSARARSRAVLDVLALGARRLVEMHGTVAGATSSAMDSSSYPFRQPSLTFSRWDSEGGRAGVPFRCDRDSRREGTVAAPSEPKSESWMEPLKVAISGTLARRQRQARSLGVTRQFLETTSSRRRGWSAYVASSGRRARRSSDSRSSGNNRLMRRSTRNTRRFRSRVTRFRNCSQKSSVASCTGGPERRTSRFDSRT
jgi:hypothetical protein